MTPRDRLGPDEARRIALAAQGFADRRPVGRVDRRHLRRVFDRMGVVQIDSVNVVVRSQELPLFARLGPHPRTLIPDATADGELFEYWVHEASHVPMDHHHLVRWKMRRPHHWSSLRRLAAERPHHLDEVYRLVADRGPVTAADVSKREGPKGSWWDWDDGKMALEALFYEGRLSATRRAGDFARLYDLTERVIPADVLARPTPEERDARKELLVMAARSQGVATLGDLADYHRMLSTVCRPLVDELVEEGRLRPVTVDGWDRPAYLHPDAVTPRSVQARALLSPFDPVVWCRDRASRLFGFDYRIEIYVPKPKRRYGYYVLPFLLGDRLVGRIDLKADRAGGRLLVQAAWAEPGEACDDVAAELAAELALMADWLGLDRGVVSVGVGDLSPALRRVGVPTATPG